VSISAIDPGLRRDDENRYFQGKKPAYSPK
jgi:hypothetical protein